MNMLTRACLAVALAACGGAKGPMTRGEVRVPNPLVGPLLTYTAEAPDAYTESTYSLRAGTLSYFAGLSRADEREVCFGITAPWLTYWTDYHGLDKATDLKRWTFRLDAGGKSSTAFHIDGEVKTSDITFDGAITSDVGTGEYEHVCTLRETGDRGMCLKFEEAEKTRSQTERLELKIIYDRATVCFANNGVVTKDTKQLVLFGKPAYKVHENPARGVSFTFLLGEENRFKVGDPVNARWTDGKFYEAKIFRVNSDWTYDVQWDMDGTKSTSIPAYKIRKR
jgi:hypothetical protein